MEFVNGINVRPRKENVSILTKTGLKLRKSWESMSLRPAMASVFLSVIFVTILAETVLSFVGVLWTKSVFQQGKRTRYNENCPFMIITSQFRKEDSSAILATATVFHMIRSAMEAVTLKDVKDSMAIVCLK